MAATLLRVYGGLSEKDYLLKEKSRQLLGRQAICDFANMLVSVMFDELAFLDCPENQKDRFSQNVLKRVQQAILGGVAQPVQVLQLTSNLNVK